MPASPRRPSWSISTVEAWDRLFNINLRANWLLAKAAHPHLRKSKGAIVMVSSMSGVMPQLPTGAYSPAKAALIMLTEMMAMEWAPDGIRANAVCPGFVHTSMTEAIYSQPKLAQRAPRSCRSAGSPRRATSPMSSPSC